jgi:hypothetical protein
VGAQRVEASCWQSSTVVVVPPFAHTNYLKLHRLGRVAMSKCTACHTHFVVSFLPADASAASWATHQMIMRLLKNGLARLVSNKIRVVLFCWETSRSGSRRQLFCHDMSSWFFTAVLPSLHRMPQLFCCCRFRSREYYSKRQQQQQQQQQEYLIIYNSTALLYLCVVHLQDKVTPSTKALWPGASFQNRSY